ncbi:hypothetical protein CDAR_579001 [Caerostris darwini]|uniref:Insulin-like domain-containing protein n=1 Tax=Caerostris darwini TaxID=1538125 RepID=A0AAV4RSH8_9ARAC|nr:hypothetical protein CDAR_579001 [Caerostris darwini]
MVMKVSVLVFVMLCMVMTDFVRTVEQQGYVRACGRSLSQLLNFVCRGHYYEPSLNKRNSGSYYIEGNDTSIIQGPIREKRGVANECCRQPCSFTVLRSYCGSR